MNQRLTLFNALSIFFLLIAAPGSLWGSLEKIKVRVAKEAWIRGEVITLGQIAHIKGDNRRLIGLIKTIELGRAPEPKQSRRLKRATILRNLKKYKIHMADVQLIAPKEVKIFREYQEITREEIARLVEDYLLKNLNWPRDMMKVAQVSVRQGVVLPKGDLRYRIRIPTSWRRLGRIRLPVVFMVDGKDSQSLWVHARVMLYKMIVVANRDLRRGESLYEEDVLLRRKAIGRKPEYNFTSLSTVVGKRLRRPIFSDEPIRKRDLEIIPLVKSGDVVTLVAENSLLKVTTLGIVRQKGGKGDNVQVLNLSSKKQVYGRVIDPKTVRVDF